MSSATFYKTPQITTADFTTQVDSTQQNYPLGGYIWWSDSAGRPCLLQYVEFAPTGAGSTVTKGAPLYYVDATKTTVTNTVTEAASYAASSFSANGSFAGLSLNATFTKGTFIWIMKKGYFASVTAPVSIVTGDIMVCSNTAASAPTDNVLVRVAAGVAPVAGATLGGYIRALGSVANGIAPGWVSCEE